MILMHISLEKVVVMKKEDVSIRQRPDGRYEGRTVIDGVRYSRYGKTISEVKQKLKSLRQEKETGGVIAKSVRLNVALDQYLKNVKMSKVKDTTYDRVESTFKYHIQNEALGRMQIGAITSTDIQKHLMDQCNLGLSKSSIKKIYNLLGEFFRYAAATRIIGYNPMTLVTMPHASNIRHESKEIETMTTDELLKVIETAEECYANGRPVYRYGEAIILLCLTGMRSGELRGINIRDIDMSRRTLSVSHNVTYAKDRKHGGIQYSIGDVKTQKSHRNIPLNSRAILAIERLQNTTCNHDTGYLICTANGKIVTHSHLQRCYSAILKKAGVRHMGLHSTRHTFATIMLKDAEDKGQIKEVSELLGHSQVSTTYEYYIKASDKDKRKLIEQLDNLVS